MQREWRNVLSLDLVRQRCMRKRWADRVEELVKRNGGKTKRQQALVRRLRTIGEEHRDKAIRAYFREAKMKYIEALRALMKDCPTRFRVCAEVKLV